MAPLKQHFMQKQKTNPSSEVLVIEKEIYLALCPLEQKRREHYASIIDGWKSEGLK